MDSAKKQPEKRGEGETEEKERVTLEEEGEEYAEHKAGKADGEMWVEVQKPSKAD